MLLVKPAREIECEVIKEVSGVVTLPYEDVTPKLTCESASSLVVQVITAEFSLIEEAETTETVGGVVSVKVAVVVVVATEVVVAV